MNLINRIRFAYHGKQKPAIGQLWRHRDGERWIKIKLVGPKSALTEMQELEEDVLMCYSNFIISYRTIAREYQLV